MYEKAAVPICLSALTVWHRSFNCTGRIGCEKCAGSGWVECLECNGNGDYDCPHCGQYVECEECEGSGRVECPTCNPDADNAHGDLPVPSVLGVDLEPMTAERAVASIPAIVGRVHREGNALVIRAGRRTHEIRGWRAHRDLQRRVVRVPYCVEQLPLPFHHG